MIKYLFTLVVLTSFGSAVAMEDKKNKPVPAAVTSDEKLEEITADIEAQRRASFTSNATVLIPLLVLHGLDEVAKLVSNFRAKL